MIERAGGLSTVPQIFINDKYLSDCDGLYTLEQNGIEEHLDFSAETFGYNFEIEHFNQLLRDNKKESELMSFSFSKDLIATLDSIRKNINLKY